ncbi:MAG: site-specific DNA-methyltransferase [Candidatus Peribacteraceae bacterium]|jgi:site-specific DNA-methyltransferase (adenine-specific)
MSARTIAIGDIYRVGNHVVACGDSRDKILVSRALGEERVDLILSDVPYGIALVEGKAAFTKGKSKHVPILNDHLQSDTEFSAFTFAWLDAVSTHMAKKNAAYVFIADKTLFALRDGMLAAGWKFGQLLFWLKTASSIGRLNYTPMHECILYAWRNAHEFYKSNDRSILIYPKPHKNVLHPSAKPVGLLRRLILNSSRRKALIYDAFAGSGSTAVAAEETGRRSVMIELDPHYCTVCLERLERCTGEKALLLSPSRHVR